MIRAIEQNDFAAIYKIWEKFYKEQFPFPDFLNYMCAFVVYDDNEQIITAGGIKPIAEALLITDKSVGTMTRSRAFGEMRAALEFVARTKGFNNLYAFIKDDVAWSTILRKVGFKEETVLYMEL
jgi:hypothetical protein